MTHTNRCGSTVSQSVSPFVHDRQTDTEISQQMCVYTNVDLSLRECSFLLMSSQAYRVSCPAHKGSQTHRVLFTNSVSCSYQLTDLSCSYALYVLIHISHADHDPNDLKKVMGRPLPSYHVPLIMFICSYEPKVERVPLTQTQGSPCPRQTGSVYQAPRGSKSYRVLLIVRVATAPAQK